MIEKFRKASGSWVVRGLFLFMAIAFALMWGGGDFIGRMGGGQQTVITVGKRKISNWEFAETVNHQIAQIQLRTGQVIDENQARQFGLISLIRERMINEALLMQEAERLGILVTDDYIRKVIKKDKTFANSQGQFDKQRFDLLLSKIGYTEKKYIESLKGDLTRERLIDALRSGIMAPLTMTIPLYRWEHELRQINTVILESKKVHINEKPTEEQLKAFYQEHKADFKAPEYRDFSAIVLDHVDIMDTIHPGNEELNAAYQARKSEFKGKSFAEVKDQLSKEIRKQRASEHLHKMIAEIEDALGAGHNLQEIAQKFSLKLKSYTRLSANGQADPFPPKDQASHSGLLGTLEQSIVKEAFNIEPSTTSGIIDGGEGRYFIVHLDNIAISSSRTFEQMLPYLDKLWIRAEQLKRTQLKAQQLMEEINKNVPFAVATARMNLKQVGCKISRQGPVAPSVLKFKPEALERLYATPKKGATAFVYNQSADGAEIMVAVVNSIERPDIHRVSPEEMKKTHEMIKHTLINDVVTEYLFALRKRFPVEVNKRFFAKS